MLGQLLLRDVKRSTDGGVSNDDCADGSVSLKEGVSKDRMVSVHDPEMRHVHKNKSRRFDGHKAAMVVDTDSQLITAVDVLPGYEPDNLGVLELVEQSEAGADVPVVEAMRDKTPPTATTAPARFSQRPGAGWWPECRVGPTTSTFPRKTSSSIWPREFAPVRRDRSPAPSCRRGNAPTVLGRYIGCRPSGLTAQCARAARCGPSASRPKAGRAGRC